LHPVIAIVQARMGSSRLPGKTLADLGGRPLLQFMLERVARASTLDEIVVATTTAPRDDAVAQVAAACGATVFRGSEDDVLAAQAAKAETVVRLTADCPLLAAEVIDRAVGAFEHSDPPVDLLTNAPPEGRTYPDGMDVEVLSYAALTRAHEQATDPLDREHPTRFLHGGDFSVHVIHLPRDLGNVRITVDDERDLRRVRDIVAALPGARFTLDDVIALLQRQDG
jgi:spore coat polysaccharide biosynthesis protein SpsF (cytidylyltransferase family)